MKILLFALVSSVLVSAGKCSSDKAPSVSGAPLVQLNMYGCRGYCPTYNLLFHNNGVVAYEGVRNMAKQGLDTVQLTRAELDRLRSALKEVNLWQYPERIESQVADAPSARLTVFEGEKRHEVYGSIDRPKPILDFENLLKDLAEAHGLKIKVGVDPYAAPPNQQEIVVKFKPEINPGNFMMQFQEVKLRIVRRVSAENEWIIGYNPDQIMEKQLMDLLKDMEGVLSVKPAK